MTRAQLTTILLYLKNAATFADGTKTVARKAGSDKIEKRLTRLTRRAIAEVMYIDDLRASVEAAPLKKEET